MKCDHYKTELHSGMYSTAEAPYDGTDFWWTLECVSCGEEVAEGDGYSKPPTKAPREQEEQDGNSL